MKPTIATFDLILTAAKNFVQTSILKRDNSDSVTLESVSIKVVDVTKKPWILFEVLFVYYSKSSSTEINDDLRVLVPWDSNSGRLGELKGNTF